MFTKQKTLAEDDILGALAGVRDPLSGADIVSAGMVQGLQILAGGHVVFTLQVEAARGPAMEPLRQAAEAAVAVLPGVVKVSAILTAERAPAAPDPHGMSKNPPLQLPIRKIVAVASGKGGVGKSTVAAHLALALVQCGLKVGLLDADIYGPSVPRLMNLQGHKPAQNAEGKLVPPATQGLKVMSIGFMVDDEAPMIWRGPMVQSAIYQMLRDVEWRVDGAPLDILIVDMPPGTGDAQLTMAQKVPLAGAVIVSTPQDLALSDARKGIEMFRKVGVPILGVIENMSVHVCSQCGHEEHIFGHGGARAEAEKRGVPFLGEVPLHGATRQAADEGRLHESTGPERPLFTAMAETLAARLGI